MALSKQITSCRIVANSTNHDLKIQDMGIKPTLEFFNDSASKKALSGKLIQRVAGVRYSFSLDYNANLEPSAWRTLINNILTHFVTNNQASLDFYPNSSALTSGDKIACIVTNLEYLQEYSNTISIFKPRIELQALNRQTSITSNFEGV